MPEIKPISMFYLVKPGRFNWTNIQIQLNSEKGRGLSDQYGVLDENVLLVVPSFDSMGARKERVFYNAYRDRYEMEIDFVIPIGQILILHS